ncbi:TetR/AcrR family transcriptional regulator [Hominifimenecus sp. rT4P-3]|uniref:TetR/AcrR family transcriptional regulator n=1 Tax=Hominifimenecus sp. rT4P-3 TaxID=3242979 RepID=UPI003DA67805
MAQKESTKNKIARIAWKLFHEKGYENTTIDEIIAESGTSKGSFYHYYSGKDELLSTLSSIFDAKYEELIQTIDPDMNSYEKLLYLCCEVHRMIEEEIPIDLLASMYASQVIKKGDKHLVDQNRYYYRIINQLVDEGQRRGQITKDLPYYEIAQLYIISERALIYDYCISDGGYSLEERTKKMMPLMFGGIQTGK